MDVWVYERQLFAILVYVHTSNDSEFQTFFVFTPVVI